MEARRIAEFPKNSGDNRPQKRPRWCYDIPPPFPSPLYEKHVSRAAPYKTLPRTYRPHDWVNSPIPSNWCPDTNFCWYHDNSPPRRPDTKDGHYVYYILENLNRRYRIQGKLGEGTFGQVLHCFDKESKEIVAIKVVRSLCKYREAAMIEIKFLKMLARLDVGGTHFVQIRNWFDYRNHICIVFEKLGPSLYDILRKNSHRSFPINLVREVGRQLLECLAFMHDAHLIHTDLKPENILFISSEYVEVPDYKSMLHRTNAGSYFKRLPKSGAIKLIDFGSTTSANQDHSYVVSTRHYRAPEVILGLGWSYPCDLWSVGCILIELCSGDALFQTHENLEHLAMMERVLGPIPRHMAVRADHGAEKYFRRGANLHWPAGTTSEESVRAVCKLSRLPILIMRHVDQFAGELIDLLNGLLHFDPAARLRAREALRHPFFTRDVMRSEYSPVTGNLHACQY